MPLTFTEAIIAGGPADFIQVRHLRLAGTNFEIGQKLAETARALHGYQPPAAAERITAAQRCYMRRNYPIHFERMRGAAQAFGCNLEDYAYCDTFDFSMLNYFGLADASGPAGIPGCTSVYYPPRWTESQHGLLCRNFDFTTGTFAAQPVPPGQVGAAARPYLIETYPDRGYPALYLACYDLFGCTDGINAAGLVVAMNGDAESGRRYPMQPTFGGAVGINEIQLPRLLLDTCATAAQARDLLLSLKHYYMYAPCHYLIADRTGDSFVFEFAPGRNHEVIVDGSRQQDGSGCPQVLTNHLIYGYASIADLPVEEFGASSYARFRAVTRAIDQTGPGLSAAQARAINAQVEITDDSYPQPLPVPDRTIWRALYDCAARSLTVNFYLRDQADPASGKRIPLRTADMEFALCA